MNTLSIQLKYLIFDKILNNLTKRICLFQNNNELANSLLRFYTSEESLNKKDKNGDFALLYAAYNKNSEMTRRLLELGAAPDLTNEHNGTALWYAVYNNDKNTFFELARYCKNLEANFQGITTLFS